MLLPHEPTAADRLKNVCGHGDGGGYEGVRDEFNFVLYLSLRMSLTYYRYHC